MAIEVKVDGDLKLTYRTPLLGSTLSLMGIGKNPLDVNRGKE